jgi:hypothetical protein
MNEQIFIAHMVNLNENKTGLSEANATATAYVFIHEDTVYLNDHNRTQCIHTIHMSINAI